MDRCLVRFECGNVHVALGQRVNTECAIGESDAKVSECLARGWARVVNRVSWPNDRVNGSESDAGRPKPIQ